MLLYYYLTALLLPIVLIASFFICRKFFKEKSKISNDTFLKICSLLFLSVFFFRYMLGGEALNGTLDLTGPLFDTRSEYIFSTLGVWTMLAVAVILVLYGFFNFRAPTNYLKFIATPLIIFQLAILQYSIVGVCGKGALDNFDTRAFLMSIEIGLAIFYCFFVWFTKFKTEKWSIADVGKFVASLFAILLVTLPTWAPQLLFGLSDSTDIVKNFSQWHRIFFYFALLIPLAIYFIFRDQDYKTRKYALLFIALATLITFLDGAKFARWANPLSWPIHLCNTAMYLIFLCLVFRMKSLFYFTLFINVLGAFIAILMPDANGNILSGGVLRFWNNHYCAFGMPILMVALGMYERPKLKEFLYALLGFTMYFVFVLIINAWFSNYGKCDYFYTNSNFATKQLGPWAEATRIPVSFMLGSLTFTFYPLYQVLFYIVYVSAALGVWFVYEQMYSFIDLMNEIRNRKKKFKMEEFALMSQLNGRSMSEPMNIEHTDKLILDNFTKRYGNSSTYAVKDANLEVHGGEIFGFLGPNGAGKSTIIKSIVGIQPITNGRIEICGYDADMQALEAKRQIGFVPDHYALYEKLTGREYINYIADIYKVSTEERNERIEKYVNMFELQGAFDNQMKTYSHGMKQKIAIMSALVHNPKVWILDEPLTGLDPNSIFQVKECMKQHAKEGNIVFFSSHIIDVVERICDRIGIIKKGQIQCVKKVEDILKEGTLEDFYLNTIENSEVKAIEVDKEILKKEAETKRATTKEQRMELKKEREEKRRKRQEQKALKQNDTNQICDNKSQSSSKKKIKSLFSFGNKNTKKPTTTNDTTSKNEESEE